ncbi:hypothetical protein HK103_002089 [Boothiomyces macroporosus]|uniref:Uncharacterized protein n=1 Tax=Boothiomyces macroporosus TaxID=261099 RepID=A0AAD5UJ20_9FUNG|nr:hypothetical protein HK103_002089 [Boothiomyces macroporosus]
MGHPDPVVSHHNACTISIQLAVILKSKGLIQIGTIIKKQSWVSVIGIKREGILGLQMQLPSTFFLLSVISARCMEVPVCMDDSCNADETCFVNMQAACPFIQCIPTPPPQITLAKRRCQIVATCDYTTCDQGYVCEIENSAACPFPKCVAQ